MKLLFPLLLAFALSAGAAHAQDNTAFLSQVGGAGNEAYITQAGDHGVVLLEQIGAGNTATLHARSDAYYGGSFNTVLLTQSGGAEATLTQVGSNHTVWGLSPGTQANSLDGSFLSVVQRGYGQALWLDQQNGAAATVVQMGAVNTATVIQSL